MSWSGAYADMRYTGAADVASCMFRRHRQLQQDHGHRHQLTDNIIRESDQFQASSPLRQLMQSPSRLPPTTTKHGDQIPAMTITTLETRIMTTPTTSTTTPTTSHSPGRDSHLGRILSLPTTQRRPEQQALRPTSTLTPPTSTLTFPTSALTLLTTQCKLEQALHQTSTTPTLPGARHPLERSHQIPTTTLPYPQHPL